RGADVQRAVRVVWPGRGSAGLCRGGADRAGGPSVGGASATHAAAGTLGPAALRGSWECAGGGAGALGQAGAAAGRVGAIAGGAAPAGSVCRTGGGGAMTTPTLLPAAAKTNAASPALEVDATREKLVQLGLAHAAEALTEGLTEAVKQDRAAHVV